MAEVKHRCRLYFQFPAHALRQRSKRKLAQAMATTDAACVLLCREDGARRKSCRPPHRPRAGHGLACLIDQDAGLAERLGADGVHIEADAQVYAKARKLLGESASIGAGCGLSRHDAMRLAELGADYVAFGPARHYRRNRSVC